MSTPIAVDANTILQANTTVIAGLLIFLTIYSLKPKTDEVSTLDSELVIKGRALINIIIGTAMAVTLSPFSLSSALLLAGFIKYAEISAFYGFIILILVVPFMIVARRLIVWTLLKKP